MSYSLDIDIQEDLRTFPMYQRLRKINPYAYYSLSTQKQMQSDLRNFGSLTFFEQNNLSKTTGVLMFFCIFCSKSFSKPFKIQCF